METIQQNQVGYVIVMPIVKADGAPRPLNDVTSVTLIFQPPNGPNFIRPATVAGNAADGNIQYVTVPGDLAQWGWWSYQAYIIEPNKFTYTARHRFYVEYNLVPPPIVICPRTTELETRAPVSGLNVYP